METIQVTQLVDYGIKIVRTGAEIQRSLSGASVNNTAIEDTSKDLQGLLTRLKACSTNVSSSPNTLTAEQASLEKIAKRCDETASELIARLDSLKGTDITLIKSASSLR